MNQDQGKPSESFYYPSAEQSGMTFHYRKLANAFDSLHQRLVSAEAEIKELKNKPGSASIVTFLDPKYWYWDGSKFCNLDNSPTQEATKPECSHPIIRISPSSLSGKLNNLTCVDCGEDLTCVDCGKDFMPNVVPTTEPRKLANKLHNARHVASGMTESKAEVNWNQHTEASQQHVWGHVAEVAVKEVERVIDGWNLFYDKCMAENLKTELRRKLL